MTAVPMLSSSAAPLATGADARAGLLAAVAAVRDVVVAHADDAETARTLPAVTVDALRASGLLSMKVPAALGGAEADLHAQFDAIAELTYLDPAAGWCTMVGASAIGWIAAFLDDAAIDEIFAGGRAPAAAVVVYPAGIATPCGDGYRVTGRWAFASGVRHADWIVLGVRVQHRSHDPRGHRMVVVPASAVSISDDWHAVGLAGTGSCGVSLIDGDVPASFTWDFTYGRPYRGGPLYRLGWPGFVAHEPAAFAVGVAYRALDALVEQTSRSAAPASARIEYSLGAAELRLRGARALVRELCDAAWDAAVRTDAVPDTLQAEMRAAAASTTDAAMDVIVQAYRAAGGAAVYRASVLQRCLRDLSAAGQHWLASDAAYETYGHHLLRRSEHGTDHGLGRRHQDRPGAGA